MRQHKKKKKKKNQVGLAGLMAASEGEGFK